MTKDDLIRSLTSARAEGRVPRVPWGSNLGGAHLGGAYLRGADLGGAHLGGADLGGAHLGGAYLRGAYLGGAYLRGAYLGGADLGGAYLGGADLGGADLGGAYLGGAYLRGAYLGGAYLRGAYLRGAYLRGADLGGAYLRGADLGGAIHEHIMPINAGPSGDGALFPTHEGWQISIGCWRGKTLAEFDALLADDVEWPEARGDERDKRRPLLQAYRALANAFIASRPDDLIEQYKAGHDQWLAEKEAKEKNA